MYSQWKLISLRSKTQTDFLKFHVFFPNSYLSWYKSLIWHCINSLSIVSWYMFLFFHISIKDKSADFYWIFFCDKFEKRCLFDKIENAKIQTNIVKESNRKKGLLKAHKSWHNISFLYMWGWHEYEKRNGEK